ncbi:ATP-binding protein [Amycolatopsis sp. NPDC051903]|uniref:ATP-binding protein n=1 Tax=Amycolatopsis sp. NPDC051903 TaxID=3363936 RepID=UPI0037AF60E3
MPGQGWALGLRGRDRERAALEDVLRDVRAGRSRVLVVRGEAGVGKTALLDHLAGQAPGRVVRTVGVQSESELSFAGLQRLCRPLLGLLDRLPEPQRDALATAFGLAAGNPPEGLLLGLAVLGLFAEAAAEKPLVCVVDDVQWLDRMSEVILTFVARRLDAEAVALVFAVRPVDEDVLGGLPELVVEGLADADARALLDATLAGPVDERVRDRIVAETRGNPLALLELCRGLTPAELAFGFGTRAAVPVGNRIEEEFGRRVAALPESTRRLLLAAAVEPTGDVPLLWRALDHLGVDPGAAAPAEAAGLLELGTRVRFRHPLVRSAAWREADAAQLRDVHRALAEATDPEQHPDRRAWHRAHATTGPDETVAAELEQSAGRALARGGPAAAGAFFERAAELTPDPKTRAARAFEAARARFASGSPLKVPDLLSAAELGSLDPLHRAGVERLRAQVAFALNRGRAAGPPLLAAARRLEELDLAAARETYLLAASAAVHAGRLGGDALATVAAAAQAVPGGTETAGRFLTGMTAWSREGYAKAVPALRHALDGVTDADVGLVWLTVPVAVEVWDDAAWHRLTEHAIGFARATGALALLPAALVFRAGALLFAGEFADAGDLVAEAEAFGSATGLAVPPSAGLALAAHRGREQPALDRVETTIRTAETTGEGRLFAEAGYAKAVLYNGLGRYPAALDAARDVVAHPDFAVHNSALGELVEAAAHAGEVALAAEAREQLTERTAAAGTGWALGVQALADAVAGPRTRAEDRYREAIDRLSASRMAVHLARARLLHGEWLRRENRRADARAPLRAAHEAFTAMGAEAFAQRAGRELAATGETVRKRSSGSWDELTPQETQIARLAVAGRTNPEIAEALFLSPRTVEWHLRKVFTKLGIASRRELGPVLK